MSKSDPVAVTTDGQSLRATLQLALVPGVGPRTYRSLVTRFGCAQSVLDAPVDAIEDVPGVDRQISRRIRTSVDEFDVDREIQICRDNDITILTEQDSRYPRLLREIPDPPVVLFCQGAWCQEDSLAIAIVGTRRATQYGLRQADRFASGLAQIGLTVVSGSARGIDAAAHRAAIRVGGRTIAVLGSGLLNVYPPEHGSLAAAVRDSGVAISELPPFRKPMSGTFPQRNRLISGLSLGVVVVEAAGRSGAQITASHASEQGREVFAVPGPADSRVSHGCHQLIRDGAKLIESVEDILEELGPLVEGVARDDGSVIRHPAELRLNEQERSVLNAIPAEPTDIDRVALHCGLPIQRVLATLSVLEIRHLIRRVGGNRVMRF